MDSLIINYILPIFGLLILLFCILAFIFPYGERFKGRIQKITAFGMNFEVSVLTIFIIIGVVFSGSGLYIYVNNYEAQISEIKARLAEAEEKDIVLLVSLEGVSEENEPNLADLQCHYRCPVLDQEMRADVSKGYVLAQYKIHLRDIKRTTYIIKLTIEDAANGRKWVKENFAPFEPYYKLKVEN